MSTETTGAVVVGEAICLGLVSTKASKTDGLGIEATGEVALERVASKHAEALGECV